MRLRRSNGPTAGRSALCRTARPVGRAVSGLARTVELLLLRGELQRALDLAERLVVLAEEQGAPLRRAHGLRAVSDRRCSSSDGLSDASQQLERGIALDDCGRGSGRTPRLSSALSRAPRCLVSAFPAWALWFLGYPDHALETARAALDLASASRSHTASPSPQLRPLFCTTAGASSRARERGPRRPSASRASITCRTCSAPATMGPRLALVGLGRADRRGSRNFRPVWRLLERDRCPLARYPVAGSRRRSAGSGRSARRCAHGTEPSGRNRRGRPASATIKRNCTG